MPLSYAQSRGDGINRNFDVPCEYLSRSHVDVKVDGVSVPFTWIDTFRLRTNTPPAAGSVVEVRRTTPREDRLVTFKDGSTLVETDLNTSSLQSFFLAQEAFDQGAASMAVTEDGQYSAQTRRVTVMGDPIHDQDAVTKRWAETGMTSQLALATAERIAAQTARVSSEAAFAGATAERATAQAERQAAQTARSGAEAARDSSSGHRLNAQNAQHASEAARDISVARAAEATAARGEVATMHSETRSFRDNASASATRAEAAMATMENPVAYTPQSKTPMEQYYARLNLGLSLGLQNPSSYNAGTLTTANQHLEFGSYLTAVDTVGLPIPVAGVLVVAPRWGSQTHQTYHTLVAPFRTFERWHFTGGGTTEWLEVLMGFDAAEMRTKLGIVPQIENRAIGYGQTWQSVSRVGGTSYQNTTGRPIMVSMHAAGSAEVSPDNYTWVSLDYGSTSVDYAHTQFIVPNGHYYRNTGAITRAAELR